MAPEPREVYVPTRLPDGGAGTAGREAPWPRSVFTPGDGGRERTLAERVREVLGSGPARPGAGGPDGGVEALFRSPEVAREVVERLRRQAGDLACTAVVALGPGGALVGAPLAVDAGLPLLHAGPPEEGGRGGDRPGGGQVAPATDALGAEDRVILVDDVADSGERLAAAVERVEATGARVAAVAVVVEVHGGGARELMGERNLLSAVTL